MIILDETSTVTRTKIRLHKFEYEAPYWVWECIGHGALSLEFDTEEEAVSLTRDSRKWCVGCSEGYEVAESKTPGD